MSESKRKNIRDINKEYNKLTTCLMQLEKQKEEIISTIANIKKKITKLDTIIDKQKQLEDSIDKYYESIIYSETKEKKQNKNIEINVDEEPKQDENEDKKMSDELNTMLGYDYFE